MSRKDILKKMSSLIGNAAAHRALEPGSAFSLCEAWLYETQATEEAEMRTWNESEITLFRDRALRYAKNVIRNRSRSHRRRSVTEINAEAMRTIDEFIEKELRK